MPQGREAVDVDVASSAEDGHDDRESDGRFMLAMGKAGLTVWEPDGLVIELTDLVCRKLNEGLTSLLDLDEGLFGSENLPQAVVVGPRCERAIRTFFTDDPSCIPRPTKQCSRNIADAIDHVEEEMAKLDSIFGGKARQPESP